MYPSSTESKRLFYEFHSLHDLYPSSIEPKRHLKKMSFTLFIIVSTLAPLNQRGFFLMSFTLFMICTQAPLNQRGFFFMSFTLFIICTQAPLNQRDYYCEFHSLHRLSHNLAKCVSKRETGWSLCTVSAHQKLPQSGLLTGTDRRSCGASAARARLADDRPDTLPAWSDRWSQQGAAQSGQRPPVTRQRVQVTGQQSPLRT